MAMPREPLNNTDRRLEPAAELSGDVGVARADNNLLGCHAGAQRGATHQSGLLAQQIDLVDARPGDFSTEGRMLLPAAFTQLEHIA